MSTPRGTFRTVVLVSPFAFFVATSHAQEKPTSLREAGQRYGLDVGEINRRLPPGQRVVGIEPPLEDEDYVLPPRLADRADAIERLPAGVPIVTIEVDDDATRQRGSQGSVASGELPDSEALVFLQRADSGFFFPTKPDAGTFEANQLILGNGYVPGVTPLTGFDFTVFNSNGGPSGPADVEAELWNSDPLGLVDVHCGQPAPIAGTSCTFSDLPDASLEPCATGPGGVFTEPCVGLHKLRCSFAAPVTVACDSVWLVWRPTAGCRIGWRLAGELGVGGTLGLTPPEIGAVGAFTGRFDCGQFNLCGSVPNPGCANDTSGRNCGTCCDNGLPPNTGGTPCDHTNGTLECSHVTFCTDGVAELEVVTVYPPGSGSYASYVASVYSEARIPIHVVPVGTGPNGQIDPGVTIKGTDIFLPSGGRRVFFDYRFGDWDPDDVGDELLGYSIWLDAASYISGSRGTLSSANLPCANDAECVAAFGAGALCNRPFSCPSPGVPCTCMPVLIDEDRGGENRFLFTEPVFCGALEHTGDLDGLDLGCAINSPRDEPDPEPFPAGGLYAGTIVLDVPVDAQGTFTVTPRPAPVNTFGDITRGGVYQGPAQLMGLAPARIHLPCADTPEAGSDGVARNRYLTVRPKTGGRETALRVTLENLPSPFDAFSGRDLWVGPPRKVSELAGSSGSVFPAFPAATLQCDPFFTDWHGRCVGVQCAGGLKETAFCSSDADCGGELQVYHALVVPGGRYSVRTFDPDCAGELNMGFSEALSVSSTRWGDLVGPFGSGAWSGPDGRVNIVTDVTAILSKFRNVSTAPVKAQCDLVPATPDQLVDISDATFVLDAFRSLPYPFPAPAWPCSP